MTTTILAAAVALSDADLLCRIDALTSRDRQTSAELVAHLAALELRPSLYAAQGYGSLFAYCTGALRLSEDAASNRIAVARISLRFPTVLELLATGGLTLSSIRMLGPHLTAENQERVLARARNRKCEEIEVLVAELAPKPDAVASVRKLPIAKASDDRRETTAATNLSLLDPGGSSAPLMAATTTFATTLGHTTASSGVEATVGSSGRCNSATAPSCLPVPRHRAHRPIVQALSPQRYRVQFTIGQEAHDQLRRLQDLLRREVPNGDVGRIFERALRVLHDQVERAKLGGRAPVPRKTRPRSKVVIRRAADSDGRPSASRHIPNAVKRTVWWRDRGQCGFISDAGHRCTERSFLELHHIQPHVLDGPATARNISLRCRRHNLYEAELVFGPDVVHRRSGRNDAAGSAVNTAGQICATDREEGSLRPRCTPPGGAASAD
jgi:hypothetical protein